MKSKRIRITEVKESYLKHMFSHSLPVSNGDRLVNYVMNNEDKYEPDLSKDFSAILKDYCILEVTHSYHYDGNYYTLPFDYFEHKEYKKWKE